MMKKTVNCVFVLKRIAMTLTALTRSYFRMYYEKRIGYNSCG